MPSLLMTRYIISNIYLTCFSCKGLYKLVVQLCNLFVEMDINLGLNIVVDPLLKAIETEAPKQSPLLARLLNLVVSIARTPSGKALLLSRDTISIIIPLLSSSSPKIAGLSFAIVYCCCSVNLLITRTDWLSFQSGLTLRFPMRCLWWRTVLNWKNFTKSVYFFFSNCCS